MSLGERHNRDRILADDKVLYKGHPIAAVAATSPHAAEEALSLIEVAYDVLPAVMDVEAAMKPGAPQLHNGYEGNVAEHTQLSLGDVAIIERRPRDDQPTLTYQGNPFGI